MTRRMTALLFLVRFFQVVPPVPRLLLVTCGAVVAAGAGATLFDPARVTSALRPLLLLQLFAAASGFAAAARRGHYDLLLARGDGRVPIALVHWGMSVHPGLAGWMAVAAAECWALGEPGLAVRPGTLVALWLVSTLPWALTVGLPRFAGAIGWLLLLGLLGIAMPLGELPPVAEALLLPVVLVGRDLGRADWPLVLPGVAVGLVAMVVACAWIHRMNVPLEASQ
jgi:hypothetical protein